MPDVADEAEEGAALGEEEVVAWCMGTGDGALLARLCVR